MKNSNLLNRLLSYSHEKQKPQRFARYAAMLIMLLTLGVGQMWADTGFENNTSTNGIKYDYSGGSDQIWGIARSSQSALSLGDVTSLTLKEFWVHMYQNVDNISGNVKMYYQIRRQAVSDGTYTLYVQNNWSNWLVDTDQNSGWQNGWRHPKFGCNSINSGSGIDLLSGLGSGKYCLRFYMKEEGSTSYLNNGDGSNYTVNWNIVPPSVSSGAVTSDGSGSGTNGSPFLVADGSNLTLTAGGSQSSTDANSVLYVKWGDDSYAAASSTTKTITPTTTKQSITVKLKYYNSADKLDGAETTLTIYYQSTVTPSLNWAASDPYPTSAVAGDEVTLNVVRANSSANITYYKKVGTGSWTSIATQSGTSYTYTIPEAHGATQTYYFKAEMSDGGTKTTGQSSAVSVYGKKTIKVRNTNSWSNFYSYVYNHNGSTTTGKREDWPGSTTEGVSALYGQWETVVLTSKYTYFIFNNGNGAGSQLSGETYTYASSVSDGGWYEISSGSGTSLSLSSSSEPAKPTVTTDDATASASTTATFGAHLTAVNRDKVTAYGVIYKQSDSNIASAAALASASPTSQNLGTNINSGTANSTTNETITAGKDWYYAAFATNGKGTSYGDIKKLRTTALTLERNGGTTGSTSVVAIGGKAMPSITKPGKTGYNFGGYYIDEDFECTQYYNSSGASATNWKTNGSASETLYAKWTAKTSTVTLNVNGATSGSDQTITATYDSEMPSTDNSSNAINKPSKTGYDFGGYYDTPSSTGGTQYYSSADPPASVRTWNKEDATTSLWARWTAQTYTATNNIDKNNSDGGGSAAGTYTATYMSNKITINTAPTRLGCHVEGYYKEAGCTHKIADASGNLQANTDYTDASSRWNVTSNQTLYVKWEADWYVYGSTTDLGGWTKKWATGALYYSAANTVQVSLPLTVNTLYEFKIYKWDGSAESYWRGAISNATTTQSNKTLSSSGDNMTFTTSASGNYTFTLNISTPASPSLTLSYPTTVYSVSFAAETFYNGGASHATSTNGGTVSAVDGYSKTLASGNKVISGGSATFTAAKNSGYTFIGWYSDAACTSPYTNGSGGAAISGSENEILTLSSIGAAKTVYAKFSEKMTTVTLNTTGSGNVQIYKNSEWSDVDGTVKVGVHTNYSIKAVPASGYYVSGWTVSDGADCNVASTAGRDDNESSSTTLRGSGAGTTGTVTARFVENEKIYFRNIFDDGAGNVSRWSTVYVGYSDHWDNSTNCNGGPCGADTYGCATALMTQIGTSDVYWAYVPRGFTTSNASTVVFFDYDMSTDAHFYGHNAARRSDYKKALNMFVPNHTKSGTYNLTDYYSNGYWMQYEAVVGQGGAYYLKRLKDDESGYDDIGEMTAIADGVHQLQYRFRVDNLTSTKNKYMISSAAGLSYQTHEDITSINCTNVNVFEDNGAKPRFEMVPTSEGYYTFILDQTGDVMRLTVDYPVSPGDYRLKHTYNDGSEKATYSDVIKSSSASSGNTVSMYLSTQGSETLVLQECTSINASTKLPVWSAGDETNLSGVLTQVGTDGDGVYQFDVTINTSTDKVTSVANTKLYDGDYYIKTNVAPGGWVNYMNNAMDENSINAAEFNYYFCKYIDDAGTNIKCVIANDYNNAITDTLKGDDVIGAGNQTLPRKGSVRFSYNSATNELKRSYISGSSDWATYFLELQAGSAVIQTTGGSTFTDNKAKFTDGGNWMYTLSLQAEEGARIKLVSHYYTGSTTKDIYLKGKSGDFANSNTEELIGGSTSKWYTLKIIYDFKTNHLLSAWSPSGDIDATINLHTDVLLIHNRKKLANPGDEVSLINLTGGDGVKDIDKVYSALRFQKTSDDNYVGLQETSATTAASYYRYNYWISFPYDVKMTDIFGINGYGSKWRIQYYDGKERAEKGWYKGDGTTSFWKTMPMSDTEKLNKGEGYVLQLSPSAFKATGSGSLWELSDEVYLYFPSKSKFGNIEKNTSSVTLSKLNCTKGLFTDPTQAAAGYSHDITDSHWHVFGIPTFNDATGTTGTGHNYYDEDEEIIEDNDIEEHEISNAPFYFYKYENSNNSLKYNVFTVTSSEDFTFQPMHAYMIQMYGTLNFATNSVPASVAARRTAEKANYNVQVELQSEDIVRDQTFVTLRDSAEVGFAFNEDLMKIHNDGKTNIYSYAGPYDVAANILPIENRTIALGVEVASNGAYTFHMPSNFSGTVTLIDTYAQTRTNLALEDYEVTLEKGTYEGRFYLELDINKVTTDVVTVSGDRLEESGIRKFIYDNQLYIMKNGIIYDARGNRVK